MHRRLVPLLLAVLVGLPAVVPVRAAQPQTTPAPAVTPDPTPTALPAPTAEPAPTAQPAPTADPAPPAPTPAPDPTPSATPLGPAATGSPVPGTVPPDPTGRFIVMLKPGADTAAVVEKGRRRDGLKADRTYARALHGFAAKLDPKQRRDLLADPNVLAVVPDALIHLTQTTPTGVSRVGDLKNPIAKIDGVDQRVDADVAIVDTGIAYHPDLNVAGGYNCSTADHTAWRDVEDHGTHVAGIVGALDNSFGVVGVAPGARVWGVKILNDSGDGLISWYVCGLDWILAQRDPIDPSRPLFEAVNMSVTKYGSDDHNCGLTNNDVLHQAICRVVAGGITVVAAAANDHHNAAANIPASYDEVITVSALADTDGIPGGLGGNRCFSWGTYDVDDTFADFSNYGSDVDLIAPGKCIMSTIPGPTYAYMSGTSMAAPTVTGAVALYKSSRPNATPAEVREALRFLGNQNWAYWTDPDPVHEPLLDVSRLGTLGTFTLAPSAAPAPTVEGGATAAVPIAITRSATFFERVTLSATTLPDGWSAGPAVASAMGWGSTVGTLSVVVPRGAAPGAYDIEVQGTNQGRTVTTTVTVNVVEDDPTALAPSSTIKTGWRMMLNAVWADVTWPAATDPSSPIAGYELQESWNGGAWGATIASLATVRTATFLLGFNASYRFRVRAMDTPGHWSPWVESVPTTIRPFDDRSPAIARGAGWARTGSSVAYRTTLSGSSRAGDTLSLKFTGHSVAVVSPRGPQRGAARVYVDGVYVTTIFTWLSTSPTRQIVFVASFPGGGAHRITLKVVGGGPHPLFQLDAFVVST